jgi:hypothetical protein
MCKYAYVSSQAGVDTYIASHAWAYYFTASLWVGYLLYCLVSALPAAVYSL